MTDRFVLSRVESALAIDEGHISTIEKLVRGDS